jgi:hypothetical protein
MNSSIERSSGLITRYKLVLLGCVCLFVAAAHVVLDTAAGYAETRLDAYLWKEEDFLRLFSPTNHRGRGRQRLLITGPSEAREALLPEELARALPGSKPYQNSESQGTLEDGLVVLDYIERAYGPAAVPDAVVFGITTRFVAGIRENPSPLFAGINTYSPDFQLDETQHPPRLVPRSPLDSLQARLALLGRQPVRYRHALMAIAVHLLIRLYPRFDEHLRFRHSFAAAKYIDYRIWSPDVIKAHLSATGRVWDTIHAWDPARDRDRVTRELRLLLDYTSRHGIELYVVNLPELSWNRALYNRQRYDEYLDVVRSALGATPFLDLRTFLSDDEFYDTSHPMWRGGIRVSKKVADFIAERRAQAATARVLQ